MLQKSMAPSVIYTRKQNYHSVNNPFPFSNLILRQGDHNILVFNNEMKSGVSKAFIESWNILHVHLLVTSFVQFYF